ncbi:MAG: hypothetical protein M1813_000952 [Trichoglossum hirsutum]|nr:MAG: hypothetical protein M1813_000952 [Trichoglossum hirsutum]
MLECHSSMPSPAIVPAFYGFASNVSHGRFTLMPDWHSVSEYDAVPVSIRYRAADFSTTASSTIFGGISATGSNSAKISPTPPAVGNHALSPGAKAGIAMGGLIGAITILGAIFGFVLLHRRRQNRGEPSELHGVSAEKHELDGSPEQKHELHGSSAEGPDRVAVSDPGVGDLSELPSALELDSLNLSSVQRNPPSSTLASTSHQAPLSEQTLTAGPVPTHL